MINIPSCPVVRPFRIIFTCQWCSKSIRLVSSWKLKYSCELVPNVHADVSKISAYTEGSTTRTTGRRSCFTGHMLTKLLPYSNHGLETSKHDGDILCQQTRNFSNFLPRNTQQIHRTTMASMTIHLLWSPDCLISNINPCHQQGTCGLVSIQCRNYTSLTHKAFNMFNESGWPDGEELKRDVDLDPKYRELFTEDYLLPDHGHRVFVIQPDLKKPAHQAKPTNPDLQLAESCALVESLPRWKVTQKVILPLKFVEKKYVYGKGNFALIKESIQQSGATAAFVSINMLSPIQFSTLQKEWGVPVYDRYTMVLQIFKLRAVTQEAKLQVALAEIPYYKSCLQGFHEGTLDQQRGGLQYMGGSGETFLEVRTRLLREREAKVKRALSRLRDQRQILRQSRENKEFPMVAVVGYTNAGKTSLIKALTKDSSMEPQNRLFATLDVTTHAGTLDNHMTVLYVDTIGFISDIPTDLMESFAATLEDMLNADVIVHVRDESHPDKTAQCQNVLETLENLKLPSILRDNIIEVANKSDLLPSHFEQQDDDQLYISTTTGQGLQELKQKLQEVIMITTDRVRKHLIVPMSGEHLSWLYKEATVESTEPVPNNTEALRVSVVMTSSTLAKFKATFGRERKKGKNKGTKVLALNHLSRHAL